MKRRILYSLLAVSVVSAFGCDDEVIFENAPPQRSGLFERTDRVFEDQDSFIKDGQDICVNNVSDLLQRMQEIADFRNDNNNPKDDVTFEELELRLVELLTDPDDLLETLDAKETNPIGGVPTNNAEQISKDVLFLIALTGSSNFLLGDLTKSPRQGVPGRDDIVGFPDPEEGPLFGSADCSPATKLWAGGYYKAVKMPPSMGEWCEKYGLEADCQNGKIQANNGEDLKISYFNAHALPVFRITLCNNDDFVREEKGFKGVGFACVNLNYICEERIQPGVIADAALEQFTSAKKGSEDFIIGVNEATCEDGRCEPGPGGNGIGLSDTIDIEGDRVGVRCDNPELDANCDRCEAVSVVMHYDFINPDDPRPSVVFGAYRGVDATAPLMDRIDLNFNGFEEPFEVIPNICNACHAGHPYEPKDPANPQFEDYNVQAQFLPINYRFALQDNNELQAFLNNDLEFNEVLMTDEPRAPRARDVKLVIKPNGAPAPFILDPSDDLSDTKKINDFIVEIDPLAYTGFATQGLNDSFEDFVDGNGLGNADVDEVELHDNDEIPAGWRSDKSGADGENFYRIVAEHCNDGCHIALPPPLDFQTFDAFKEYRETILRDMCDDYSMPHSPEAFFLFWSRSERVTDDREDNNRLNKNNDFELVDFEDREDEREDDDLRGDVELFLRFSGPGWAPLEDELENGIDSCEIPPMSVTFIRTPEITDYTAIEKKRDGCIEELKGNLLGRMFCRTLCDTRVLDEDLLATVNNFNFFRTADITRSVCQNIVDSIDDGDIEELKDLFKVAKKGDRDGKTLADAELNFQIISESDVDRGSLLDVRAKFKKTVDQFNKAQGL